MVSRFLYLKGKVTERERGLYLLACSPDDRSGWSQKLRQVSCAGAGAQALEHHLPPPGVPWEVAGTGTALTQDVGAAGGGLAACALVLILPVLKTFLWIFFKDLFI